MGIMKLSIITICYNPGPVIRSAIQSVLEQTYADVEYIVVDGASTDGTVEWLSDLKLKTQNLKLVSERDAGLYDALNKGVRMASGDVIGFVHADDFLAYPDALLDIAQTFEETGADAVYGDLQYVAPCTGAEQKNKEQGISTVEVKAGLGDSHKKAQKAQKEDDAVTDPFLVVRHWKSGVYDRRKLKRGWMPPHPTFYLKKSVYDQAVLENGEYFDTSFSCAADYDFMMRVLSKYGVEPVYLPDVLVKMRTGGVSNRSLKHIIRKSWEDWRVIRRNRIGHLHTLFWKNFGKLGQFIVKRDG